LIRGEIKSDDEDTGCVKQLIVATLVSDTRIHGPHVIGDSAMEQCVYLGGDALRPVDGMPRLGLIPGQDQSVWPPNLIEWNF
jgi:hypothetical protein